MHTPLIVANWKMNTTADQARELAQSLANSLSGITGVEVVLCPPFISLIAVKEATKYSSIELGAQNMYFQEKGAFTGEISPTMLQGICTYVILGHSERRQILGEKDELINKKVKAALKAGLKPILCVGETLEERDGGQTEEVLKKQIGNGLKDIAAPGGLVIAYEPVWAIGTGRAATGEQANSTGSIIRRSLIQIFDAELAVETRVLYGGSVTPSNIVEFMKQPDIDGALVGGASLWPADFGDIVRHAAGIKQKS